MPEEQSTQAPPANEGKPAKSEKKPPHPIASAIDNLIHRARDIRGAAHRFLPIATKTQIERYDKVREILIKNDPLLDDEDNHVRVIAQKEVHEALGRFERLKRSKVPEVLERGLFLALFSAFDAFTGDLLRGVYAKKPTLFGSLNKSISFDEVLAAPSIEALKAQVLDDDIESLRRKSYVEQFAALGNRFDVKLTAFERWPEFVECSQRRNLLTHCDGIVTDQYLAVCREAGIGASNLPSPGSRVKLGAKYFYTACELVMEVGIKLGQTLWRKTLPEDLEAADKQLMLTLYEALEGRNWSRAKRIGEFAYSQRKLFSDANKKVIIVNYAQAMKRGGEFEEAKQILDTVDWSAALNDFKLSRSVLLEDYKEAADIMRTIGKKGDYIDETGYHTWPLFIEFRETDEFTSAYLEVYGHPYALKLREEADDVSRRAAEEAKNLEVSNSSVPNDEVPPVTTTIPVSNVGQEPVN